MIHVAGVHFRGVAPAGQHSSEAMSPFQRVIEIFDYFVIPVDHRQQRKLKIVTEVNINFAWLGGELIIESSTKQQIASIFAGIGAL